MANLHYKFVQHFHGKMGCELNHPLNDIELLKRRLRLLQEEVREFEEATENLIDALVDEDGSGYESAANDYLKELTDVYYITLGNYVAFGIPANECMEKVHASNMTKLGEMNEHGKVTKGPNYKPADMRAIAQRLLEKAKAQNGDA